MEFYFEKSTRSNGGVSIMLSHRDVSFVYDVDYDEIGKTAIWKFRLDHPFLLDSYIIGQTFGNNGYEKICYHGRKKYFEAKINHCSNAIEIKTLPLNI